MVAVEAGAGAVRYLKSKLDRDVEAEQRMFPMSEAELRRDCAVFAFLSLFFAFSTAILSYSSHSFAVFAGVHGGGRGFLNGESVLVSGGAWIEGWAVVVDEAMVDEVIWWRVERKGGGEDETEGSRRLYDRQRSEEVERAQWGLSRHDGIQSTSRHFTRYIEAQGRSAGPKGWDRLFTSSSGGQIESTMSGGGWGVGRIEEAHG
jgi:hypothetical protein